METGGGSRASGQRFLYLSPHTDGLTPGPQQFLLPFLSTVGCGLPHKRKGSAGSPSFDEFIPQPDSLSYACPALDHEAAPFALCFGLWVWLAPRAEFNMSLCLSVGAGSCCCRRFSPSCRCLNLHLRCSCPHAFPAHCRGKFSLYITAQTRLQPIHP